VKLQVLPFFPGDTDLCTNEVILIKHFILIFKMQQQEETFLEKIKNYLNFFNKEDYSSSKQIQINQMQYKIEKAALTEGLNKNHNPQTHYGNYAPLAFETLQRGNVELKAMEMGKKDLIIKEGDGKTMLLNGKLCSDGADMVLQNSHKKLELQAQLKYGKTAENTHLMAEKHLQKYPEIKTVYGPLEHKSLIVQTEIEFDGLKTETLSNEKVEKFIEENKDLVQTHGDAIISIDEQIKGLSEKISKTKTKIEQLNGNPENNPKPPNNNKISEFIAKMKKELDEMEQEMKKLVEEREINLQKIGGKMTQFFKRSFDWRSVLHAAKNGAIEASGTALLDNLIDNYQDFVDGKLSVYEFWDISGVIVKGLAGGISAGIIAGFAEFLSCISKDGVPKILGLKLNQIFCLLNIINVLVMYYKGVYSKKQALFEVGVTVVKLGAHCGITYVCCCVLLYGWVATCAAGFVFGYGLHRLEKYCRGKFKDEKDKKN
jgi:hypothetical protein